MLIMDLYFYNPMGDKKNIQFEHGIYFAPIQGFTDYVYRKAFNMIFQSVDVYFIPYILIKNNEILKKCEKEILVQNNPQQVIIPQVLPKNEDEVLLLSKLLEDKGYKEINLNLGCPYPMVTNREKGAGLLPFPEKIEKILSVFFEKSTLRLSVKMRAGLFSEKEIEKVIPVLNRFPLTEVILHPRIAKQLYSGDVLESVFQYAYHTLKHKLVYNGDIFSTEDFIKRNQKFPEIRSWMLGRGILMNPFLPSEIKGINYAEVEKTEKLKEFHRLVLANYTEIMDNEGNVLNKMKQFWGYFCNNFPEQKKGFKNIKKANSLTKYNTEVSKIMGKW